MRVSAVAAVTSTGTSALTLLQVQAGSANPLRISKVSVCFAGVVTTDAPILVEVLRQTTAGTASSLTPVKKTATDSGTIQASAQDTFTVEPTAGDIVDRYYVHPQQGLVEPISDPEKFTVVASGYIAIRVTAAVAVNATASLEWDE